MGDRIDFARGGWALHLSVDRTQLLVGRPTDIYERIADVSWNGSAQQLHRDDPLVLYARAAHHAIRLTDVAPSRSSTPEGDAKPEIAIPILQHHRTIAVALYGKHRSGEHLDADEETPLTELAQAALELQQRVGAPRS